MKQVEIKDLELNLYYEKLNNGLEVYVVPKNNVSDIYVNFMTKFGADTLEFIPINQDKMIKVPNGIAHFLEHKLFEQKDSVDPFTFFSERGADCNAYTSKEKTVYLFSGPDFFEENLNYLIDYVQSPYFTDENVEKEKGIIEQEIVMYEDNPMWVMHDKGYENTFIKHPVRIPIAGKVSDIKKITKEQLYDCYNTFYHPSNMVLVITGNVDAKETIEVIKNNQAAKSFKDMPKIEVKNYDEKEKVFKEKDIIKMDVAIPKFSINYKFKIPNMDLYDFINYLIIYIDSNISDTSFLDEELKSNELITDGLEYTFSIVGDYVILSVMGESNNPDEVINMVIKTIEKLDINKDDFDRKIKSQKSSNIYLSDNIYQIGDKIVNNIINYGEVITNLYDRLDNLNVKVLQGMLKKLSFKNKSIVIVNPNN